MTMVSRWLAALLLLAGAAAPAAAAGLEEYKAAMDGARWTGPMLASTAETLPRGHFYTEPYFYDVIVGGDHHPGSSGFYQYGLADNLTVGFQPSFATATNRPGRGMAIGDIKAMAQLRLSHFTPEHRIPSIAVVLNEVLPTGHSDRLKSDEEGHGGGAFATEVGLNVQHYWLLGNGRLLRGRINLLQSFPNRARIRERSVYGTGDGFRGHARPGEKTTLIAALEYSLSREWVLAFDVIHERSARTHLTGRDALGVPVDRRFPASRATGFAPAVEYNWSDTSGILVGVWISPKGHHSQASITPALAYSRYW